MVQVFFMGCICLGCLPGVFLLLRRDTAEAPRTMWRVACYLLLLLIACVGGAMLLSTSLLVPFSHPALLWPMLAVVILLLIGVSFAVRERFWRAILRAGAAFLLGSMALAAFGAFLFVQSLAGPQPPPLTALKDQFVPHRYLLEAMAEVPDDLRHGVRPAPSGRSKGVWGSFFNPFQNDAGFYPEMSRRDGFSLLILGRRRLLFGNSPGPTWGYLYCPAPVSDQSRHPRPLCDEAEQRAGKKSQERSMSDVKLDEHWYAFVEGPD
jgi:hypothetical protein